MLAGKINEIKKSIKRVYMRLGLLTAVVIFGAIAIAQAQKDHNVADLSDAPASIQPLAAAGPLPAADVVAAGAQTEPSTYDTELGPLAAENTLPVADSEFGAADGWDPELPPAETQPAGFDQPLPEDPAVDHPSQFGDSRYSDSQDSNQEYVQHEYSQHEDGDLVSRDEEAYGEDRNAFDHTLPVLPVAATALAAEALLPDEMPERRNPFRGAASSQDADTVYDAGAMEGDANHDVLPAADDHESNTPPSDAPPLLPDETRGWGGNATPLPTRQSSGDPRNAHAYEPRSAGSAVPDESPAGPADDRLEDDREGSASFGAAAQDDIPIEAAGRPGPQSLEGPQAPTLVLQKVAPEEIQVGRPAKFEIRVRNTGRVPANNVLIRDEVPAGTQFVDATPRATRATDGAIFWEAGSLAPGQEISVAMQLMPTIEGQIGSVATVSFEASASARSRATKPGLLLEHTGPPKVLLGESVRFAIRLSNPGSGAATNVVLEEDVPEGLSHSSGARLEYEVGVIEPGQTRQLELTLKAAQAGKVLNTLIARADAGLVSEHQVELEVIAPKLQIGIEGPKRRYLDRQATFTVSVANPGTAPAKDVELVAQLPAGLKFVSTNNSGYYDQARHAVVWSLEQLPAGEMGRAQFTAMPTEMGAYRVKAAARADAGLESLQEHPIEIEGIAALLYVLTDKVDPIEIGGQTSYEIKVVNQGSKDAANVAFAALVPDGLTPLNAEGPTAETIQGQQVMFAPLDRLAPKEQAIFRILVKGETAGDHRFRVQMTSDEITTPVIKEESTRVYAD